MQMQHLPGEPDIEIGYRLLIPVVHVGALIGRGGEAIAQLRQRTGARVKVHDAHDSESLVQPHHRCVGELSCVVLASLLIWTSFACITKCWSMQLWLPSKLSVPCTSACLQVACMPGFWLTLLVSLYAAICCLQICKSADRVQSAEQD